MYSCTVLLSGSAVLAVLLGFSSAFVVPHDWHDYPSSNNPYRPVFPEGLLSEKHLHRSPLQEEGLNEQRCHHCKPDYNPFDLGQQDANHFDLEHQEDNPFSHEHHLDYPCHQRDHLDHPFSHEDHHYPCHQVDHFDYPIHQEDHFDYPIHQEDHFDYPIHQRYHFDYPSHQRYHFDYPSHQRYHFDYPSHQRDQDADPLDHLSKPKLETDTDSGRNNVRCYKGEKCPSGCLVGEGSDLLHIIQLEC